MPVKKVKGGYRWGKTGKVYPTKIQAQKQGRLSRRARLGAMHRAGSADG